MPSGPYHPCPSCKRPLLAAGRIEIAGVGVAWVYRCDACVAPLDLGDGGEPLEIALTFAIDHRGQVHNCPREWP